jgi:hypothetical protein
MVTPAGVVKRTVIGVMLVRDPAPTIVASIRMGCGVVTTGAI